MLLAAQATTATKGPSKGEKKRLAKKRRLEESGGATGPQQGQGQQQQQGKGKGNGKGKKKDKPKMTKEERRAKFLRPTKRHNRPGSAKRGGGSSSGSGGGKVFCFGCRRAGHRLAECPVKGQAFVAGVEVAEGVGRVCFNCGSTEHRLQNCRRPKVNGA